MKQNFGPWATAMNSGNNPGLSTFWKRRMGRLASVCGCRPNVTVLAAWCLLVLGCLFCVLPTVLAVTVQADGKKASNETKRPSRIYMYAMMKGGNGFIQQVIAADPKTGDWEKIVTGQGKAPRVSPDGERIAFERDGEIWTSDTYGSEDLSRIANVGGRPVWSPDGKQVLSSESGEHTKEKGWEFKTWLFSHDGVGEQVETKIPSTDQVSGWSVDGKWVITSSLRDRSKGMGWQLYLMKPDGSESRHLTRWGVNYYARFSPDSRRIAYTDSSRGLARIKIVDVEGKKTEEIFRAEGVMGLKSLSWSPDGKQLAVLVFDWKLGEDGRKYSDGSDQNFRLLIMDADGKNPRELRIAPEAGSELIHLGFPDWR